MTHLLRKPAVLLGMIRAGVHGVFLISVLATDFQSLGRLPVPLMHPPGVMRYVSWEVYDALFTPAGMAILKGLLITSLAMSTAGYLTGLTTKTSALLVMFAGGLPRSFGHDNSNIVVGLYCLFILAFAPCGDAFAVDRLGRPPVRGAGTRYGYPILLMQLMMAWSYFASGIQKLRESGLAYFGPDNLPLLSIHNSLDNLHDTQFRVAFWLPHVREFTSVALVVTVLWEITFPLAVFFRRLTWWYLGLGVVFHVGSMLTLNTFFPNQMAMYLVFVDWPALWSKLRTRSPKTTKRLKHQVPH